jgi:hypothetical protein
VPVIPALGRQRQKDLKFDANLDYMSSKIAWVTKPDPVSKIK